MNGEKKAFKLQEVKFFQVPFFEEVSQITSLTSSFSYQ
jgi:hypothetical protein